MMTVPTMIRTLLATALCVAALPAPARAAAGDFTQILCANPDTGQGTGVGMIDGLTMTGTVPSWRPAIGPDQCTGTTTDATALRLEPRSGTYLDKGDYEALHYRVEDPALSLRAATYFRSFRVVHEMNDSRTFIMQHGGSTPGVAAEPVNYADWQASVPDYSPRGSTAVPFAPANEIRAEHLGRHFTILARCDDTTCAPAAGDWSYAFYGGKAELHDSRPPTVENVSGSLTAATTTGTATLTFSAADEGAGLYRFRLWVDGAERATRTFPGPACTDVNPKNSDPYEFTHQQPCTPSLVRTERFDTTQLSDGDHRIRAVVEDAGGNQTVLVDRVVRIDNTWTSPAASGSSAPDATPVSSGTVSTSPAALTVSPPALVARPSFPGARITMTVGPRRRGTLRTSYTSRPTVHGRLVDAAGRPLGDQPIALVDRATRPGAPSRPLAVVRTKPDGTFTTRLGSGSSRTVTASFDAARATVRLVVPAAVSLTIGRAQVGRPTRLRGRLRHGPQAGVLVQVQALDGRRWRTFDTTKTRRDGSFRYAYRFKPTAGGRTFALRVLVDSPTYPFAAAASRPVSVRVTG